jgi:GT2 family glycosyltransferase
VAATGETITQGLEELPAPLVSVVILNYNGAKWIERCLESLKAQTVFDRLEILVADNLSSDGSDRLAEKILAAWPNGLFIQNGENLGFCEGNNRPARRARGEYLFFLNNDTWLEVDCLEVLVREVRARGAAGATPLVLNYADASFQSLGAAGFDIFGLPTPRRFWSETRPVLMPEGCSYLINRRVFAQVGGFDTAFVMYADEYDLSFRVWVAGHDLISVPAARVHHRGAANVNPKGGGTVEEFRTSDRVRFFSNRNCLLVVLQNAQHVLLALAPFQVLLLLAESAVSLVLLRDWRFVKRSYYAALADCWRLRRGILESRRRVASFRRRGDWRMLRFLSWRFSRWHELRKMLRMGLPKVATTPPEKS